MKSNITLLTLSVLVVLTLTTTAFQAAPTTQATLKGAWQMENVSEDHVVIFTENYFAYANYNEAAREFIVTFGGTYKIEAGKINASLEFHSGNKEQVGKTLTYPFTLSNDVLSLTDDGENTKWKKLDNGTAPLAGNWHITGRMQEGKVQSIHQTGGRKTVKILSGTRFQWAAIDTDTKEFSGTGGGTYTFQNGKYTENIEFFSRDNSRVGATLTFDGTVKSDGWHHSGLSSRGDKIYEVWNKTK